MQCSAALYDPKQYSTAAVQLQHTVQGLRDALYSAISEIKSLKDENKALKEQVSLVKNGQGEMESQLQEELKQKDQLLKRACRKRQARTGVYIDCLALLTQKDQELKKSEEQWRTRCDELEASLQQELARGEQKEQEENNTKNKLENNIQTKKEENRIRKEEKEIQKVEKMENKDYEKVEEETKRSDDKQMNEKIKKKPKKKKGKKKKNRG